MQKYNVCIKETLEKVVEVEAQSAYEAEVTARQLYYAGEIVLTPDDFISTVFSVLEEKGEKNV